MIEGIKIKLIIVTLGTDSIRLHHLRNRMPRYLMNGRNAIIIRTLFRLRAVLVRHSINQSINQQIGRSSNRSINQSVNRYTFIRGEF